MEFISKLIADPTVKNILTLLIFVLVAAIFFYIRYFLRRLNLLEMKHEATNYAIGKSFGNGYENYYIAKLNELKAEFIFKIGKE